MSLSSTTAWRQFETAVRATPLTGEGLDLVEAAGLTLDFTCQRRSNVLREAERALLDDQGCAARAASKP